MTLLTLLVPLTLGISAYYAIFQYVGELVVTVRIKDINDHTPMFTNLPNTVTVSEVSFSRQ